jgi:hypothetical protein
VIRSAAKLPAPARVRAGAAAKHLGFTPVKPRAAGAAAAAAGGVAVGDTLEIERCSFAVGPVRSPAPPHALTHARTASCVRGRPAQGDCEERTTKP